MMNLIYDLQRRLSRLEAALQNLVMPSQQMQDTGEQTTTATVRLQGAGGGVAEAALHQQYGHWSRPLAKSMHTLVNVAGKQGRGIAISSNDERYRPLNLQPGDSYTGDHTGQCVWVTGGTTINIIANSTVHITAPLTLITGDLHVTGAVIAGYGGGDQVGLLTHIHAQAADSHGDSEVPTAPPTAGS